eukprot:CAMPEP_0116880568 /NCGR_PEP_ID=MMETSP0463-20121206/12504_1 /TAXON_ID=181622 /ORGANISM="Strombidinopsis sp, Strain SopsisLIS2011" /LENGTH=174 /DNA_ID=CAMNT_0004531291 /DNA_START=42 /DNA_END=566 /DNA_ORIENTATION=-
MQLVNHIDAEGIVTLNLALYYFAQYSLKPEYYYPLDLVQGLAYAFAFMAFMHMYRDDSSASRRNYFQVRQISTHVFYGLAFLNLYIDWSLYEVMPWYGLLYLMVMGRANSQWTYHAKEWMDSDYMRGDAAESEEDADMESEQDMMVKDRFFNTLFKFAQKTLEHENDVLNSLKF